MRLQMLALWGFPVALAGWVSAAAVAIVSASPQTTPVSQPVPVGAVVKQYCVTCHNGRAKTGGLSLENVDVTDVSASGDTWEQVVRKLQRHAMPPQGAPRPDEA